MKYGISHRTWTNIWGHDIITRLKTARSPMFIRWVGQNTVFVSHTSVEKGGFDIVLIDTVSNTVTHRFKSVDLVLDAVATSDTLFFGNDQSLQIYDLKTNIQRSIPIREPFGNSLLLASDPYLYISAGATEDLSGVPCNTSGNNIFRLDRTTGDLETLFSLRRLGLHGLTAIPNQTLIAFDSCVNPEHGQITVFNIPTSTIATQMLVQRDNGLAIMSPVTPQGEIAFFRIGGSVEWYDATTLEARGQTQLPIKGWISSAVVYPDETKVRK